MMPLCYQNSVFADQTGVVIVRAVPFSCYVCSDDGVPLIRVSPMQPEIIVITSGSGRLFLFAAVC